MKYYYKLLPVIFATLVLLPLSGCFFSVKPSSAKGGKKYYETFFVGDEGTQYFIKPITFVNEENSNEEIRIDFTFRYKKDPDQEVSLNYSIVHPSKVIKSVESLVLENASGEVVFTEHKYLFNQRKKDFYEARFNTVGQLKATHPLFANPDWTVKVKTDQGNMEFRANGKAQKAIQKIQQSIFVMF